MLSWFCRHSRIHAQPSPVQTHTHTHSAVECRSVAWSSDNSVVRSQDEQRVAAKKEKITEKNDRIGNLDTIYLDWRSRSLLFSIQYYVTHTHTTLSLSPSLYLYQSLSIYPSIHLSLYAVLNVVSLPLFLTISIRLPGVKPILRTGEGWGVRRGAAWPVSARPSRTVVVAHAVIANYIPIQRLNADRNKFKTIRQLDSGRPVAATKEKNRKRITTKRARGDKYK